MLCITIANESRRLALVDMLNAAPQCDLLEIRLDKFQKSVDLGEIMQARPKPLIMSCRRREDGGDWADSENERLALLRQCIISKADYVEIEHDVADQIRPYPPSKRVITYTNLETTPADLADIYSDIQTKRPDVIKLMTTAQTPEEAWPLVQILARPALPTVGVCLGPAGLMLSVLGKKIGAPWSYAALERGMEAYPDQPTVADLRDIYHYDAIERQTRFVGVTGAGPLPVATTALLNSAYAESGLAARCLPLQVGQVHTFRRLIQAVRLVAVVIDEPNRGPLRELAGELETAARHADAIDTLVQKDEDWVGYNLTCRAAVAALERSLGPTGGTDRPLENRTVMLIGVGPDARSLGYALRKRGGAVVVTSRNPDAAKSLAQELDSRVVPFEALYTTLHEVLVNTRDEEPAKSAARAPKGPLRTSYLKPGMTVLDLGELAGETSLTREATDRGCRVVTARSLLLELADLQFKLTAGREAPRPVLETVLNRLFPEFA